MELELGTGICSWAWWEEVPDLVWLVSATLLNSKVLTVKWSVRDSFKFGCCWIGKELLTVEAQFFAELG